MKNIKILLVILLAVMSIIMVGCIKRLPVPVYDMTDEVGTSVYIDGVRYKQLPALEWTTDNVDEIIGYAGNYKTFIYSVKNDPNRDFIVLKYYWGDAYWPCLYRTDKDIPEVSADSVDKIVWEDYESDLETGARLNYYANEIEEKEVIKELFDLLETGEKVQDINAIKKGSNYAVLRIDMYCTEIPGASYGLAVRMYNGRLVCGRTSTGYYYIPDDLLEKIAGKKIDVSELTEN